MLGRTAALLADTYVDLQPSGWRLVARPGLDHRRALDYLRWDLDAMQEAYAGYTGLLKVQAAGPWTLAAGIELPRGDRALSDRGAVRDLAAALREGLDAHAAEVARRVPTATVIRQLDEPSLPAVRAGRIPTASGFGALRRPEEPEVIEALNTAMDETTGIHCCAADPPFALWRGAAFVSVDLALTRPNDDLAALIENGTRLFAGTEDPQVVRRLWKELSYPPDTMAQRVVITPACGLAGRSPDAARAALTRVREAARRLAEEVE